MENFLEVIWLLSILTMVFVGVSLLLFLFTLVVILIFPVVLIVFTVQYLSVIFREYNRKENQDNDSK
jgi:ABC-type bacteriocin/lantibiotic exporter with double-glycine peptidase domain